MFHRTSSKREEVTLTKSETISTRKIPPTIISSDVRLLGNIISDGIVDMDGRIEGNIKSDTAYVRQNAMITGDIMVDNEVHIFGSVYGVVKAQRVCIYASAHVEGVIIHKSLSIEDGAYVDAQFKPFDAQPKLANSASLSDLFKEEEKNEVFGDASSGDSYDILKELKLIS